MTRRGVFGALVDGIAAAAGLRGLVGLRAPRLGCRVTFAKASAMGKSEPSVRLWLADEVDPTPATAPPGPAPWRIARPQDPYRPWGLDGATVDDVGPARAAPPAGPVALPEVWPGRSAEITATASLPPLAQVERLVALFGASGDAAPAFAAALIGELVLTRLRLDAADPKALLGLVA